MNSLTDFAGTVGCTTSRSGTVDVWTMATKSRTGSYGAFASSGFTAMLLAVPIISV
jgi:hypothetical protein